MVRDTLLRVNTDDLNVGVHLVSQLCVGSHVLLQSSLSLPQDSQLLPETLHQLLLHDHATTVT